MEIAVYSLGAGVFILGIVFTLTSLTIARILDRLDYLERHLYDRYSAPPGEQEAAEQSLETGP